MNRHDFNKRVTAPIPLETLNETRLNIQLNKVTVDSEEHFKMLVSSVGLQEEQSVQGSNTNVLP